MTGLTDGNPSRRPIGGDAHCSLSGSTLSNEAPVNSRGAVLELAAVRQERDELRTALESAMAALTLAAKHEREAMAAEDWKLEVAAARAELAAVRPQRETQLREALGLFGEYNEGEPCWCPSWWWDAETGGKLSDEHSERCARVRAVLADPSPPEPECDCRHRKDGLLHDPECAALNPPLQEPDEAEQ